MASLSIPDTLQNSFDFHDHSFHTHSHLGGEDSTGVPIFPAEEAAGHSSIPFNIEYRDLHINPLPQEPLKLFRLFVAHLIDNSIIDNWNTPISKHSRILQWEGISSATAYV
ncbi:Uncharacterized protein HZ326_25646 [Fusarium oxysporum f. sp. albedinis]|nr:Uncharacterized protein HZ326_26429 [Fusarium oxysporum f. sp. albedinis]KAJ0131263.1 Uncharacterized protein HZ326_25646 [Fusarium oxysporum f. sp. albedinis]